jgi:hypothetical protein
MYIYIYEEDDDGSTLDSNVCITLAARCVWEGGERYICMLYIASTAKSILFIVSCNCRLAPLSFNGTATRKGDFFPTLLFFFFYPTFSSVESSCCYSLTSPFFWGKSRKLAVIAHSLLFIFFTPPFFDFQVECVCKKKKKEGGIEEFSLSYKRDRSNTIIARMLSFLIFSFIFFLLCQLWSYRSYRDRLRSKTEKYKEKEKKKGTFKKAQENGRRKKEAERDRRRISLVRKDFRLRSRYRSSLEL